VSEENEGQSERTGRRGRRKRRRTTHGSDAGAKKEESQLVTLVSEASSLRDLPRSVVSRTSSNDEDARVVDLNERTNKKRSASFAPRSPPSSSLPHVNLPDRSRERTHLSIAILDTESDGSANSEITEPRVGELVPGEDGLFDEEHERSKVVHATQGRKKAVSSSFLFRNEDEESKKIYLVRVGEGLSRETVWRERVEGRREGREGRGRWGGRETNDSALRSLSTLCTLLERGWEVVRHTWKGSREPFLRSTARTTKEKGRLVSFDLLLPSPSFKAQHREPNEIQDEQSRA